jgi:hypothetical protein
METIMHMTKSPIVRACGAVAALFLLGCGSSSIAGNPAANYAGNWTFGSGSIQPMCNIAGIPAVDLTGDTLTIIRVDSTHVATTLTGMGVMCDVNFTVAGNIATAATGQTCAVTAPVTIGGVSMNIAVTIDISSWTLNISGDTLTIAMTGTASAEGGLLSCTPTADGMATRPSSGG